MLAPADCWSQCVWAAGPCSQARMMVPARPPACSTRADSASASDGPTRWNSTSARMTAPTAPRASRRARGVSERLARRGGPGSGLVWAEALEHGKLDHKGTHGRGLPMGSSHRPATTLQLVVNGRRSEHGQMLIFRSYALPRQSYTGHFAVRLRCTLAEPRTRLGTPRRWPAARYTIQPTYPAVRCACASCGALQPPDARFCPGCVRLSGNGNWLGRAMHTGARLVTRKGGDPAYGRRWKAAGPSGAGFPSTVG